MARYLIKQPNGLYTIFSSIVDSPIYWNYTEEDYIEQRKNEAEQEARREIEDCIYGISMVKNNFIDSHMSQEEFKQYLKDVGDGEN